MRPFISFYGGKNRMAARLPAPRYGLVIEPFAGSLGYSTRHNAQWVAATEADEQIAAMWKWLTTAPASEILCLPLLEPGDDLRNMDVRDEAKTLIGFWINKGMTTRCNTPSKWMREYAESKPETFWGAPVRARIADQLRDIRGWSIYEGGWEGWNDVEATWFIDPPYSGVAGSRYRHGSSGIDYAKLAEFCRTRRGQVIVCEHEGADWLPFRPVDFAVKAARNGGAGYSREVIWTNDMETS